MADSRTFTLIGEFKDGITPELAKINKQLATLKAGFSGIGSRKNTGFRGATNDIGKLISAHKNLSASIKDVGGDLRSTIGVLQQYRREMGKAAAATRSFQKSGGSLGGAAFAQNMRQANSEAQAYLRTLQQINRQTPRSMRMPPGGGGSTRRGGGYDPGMGGGGGYAAAVGGGILGSQLGNTVQGAIVAGFNIGTQLMYKPFEYFSSRFGERIKDEMDDLKAAGGFYSIARRQKDPFVKSMDEAIQFQQDNNRVFANMAATLPGVTNDYVQASKRIGDTVARVVGNDLPKAIAEANKIRATEEGRKFYGGEIRGTGPEAIKQTMTTLIGDLTKQTVLAGLGGRTGAGGMMGAYGLPGLAERMISQEEVSMGQFQRYAAIFGDPMLADAMARNIDKLNATQKDSMDRVNALRAMFKEILTPELIDKLRTSFDGVYQGLYSSILDPDKGLFGLGRQMKGLGKRINSFGQYVDSLGNVVTDVNLAADVDLGIFEMLRDIFVNTGQVLSPIVEFMPQIWDPLKNIAKMLKDARHYTAEFARTFNEYREGLKAYAKGLGGAGGDKILQSLDLRASFAAINNLFAEFGVYGKDTEKMFNELATKIKDPSANLGAIAKDLLDKFFTSDIAKNIGEFLGNLVGTILKQVGDATKFVAGVTQGGGFAGGFASAFSKAGGFTAIQDIFMSIVQLFIKALITAVTKMPLLTATVVALAALPAIIGAAITNMVERCMGSVMGGGCAMPGGGGGGRGGRGGRGGLFSSPANERRRRRLVQPYAQGARTLGAFGQDALSSRLGLQPGRAMIRQRGMLGNLARTGAKAGRVIPGGALAGGAIDMGLALASGENFGKAAAGSIGTVLGGVVGSAFGPVGTMIGMAAGGMIGDATADAISNINKGPTLAQQKAAEMQVYAAKMQEQAARLSAGGLEPDKATYTFGTGQQFADRLKVLGLESDKAAQALSSVYSKRESASVAATAAAGELNKKISELRAQNIPPDLIAKQVKPLQEQFNQAKENLAAAQAAFDAQFRKTPEIIQRSITNSMSALSFKNIETILGNKIAQIQVPNLAFSLPSTLPSSNPYSQGWRPSSPILKPGGTPQWSRPATSPTGNIFKWAKGGLGDAVASELKNKPRNSNLVIANSSETVIPAAEGSNGTGMVAFVETLRSGFNSVVTTFRQTSQQAQTHLTTQMTVLGVTFKTAQERQRAEIAKISQTLVVNQQQTNAKLSALEKKFNAPAMPGGLGGGAAGGVDAFTPIASRMGLQLTSGYRPGDPGWHGANRARDYSNGTGPTPQMMQFAQHMAATYGSNLKELIYTPLGFSIKNGQRVAPYAQGAHYNHVHVAYAMGAGMPAFFSNQRDAVSWEKQHLGNGVRSITSNSVEVAGLLDGLFGRKPTPRKPGQKPTLDELGTGAGHGLLERRRRLEQEMIRMRGGRTSYMSPNGMSPSSSSLASAPINVTAPITINQQPGQNADELASIVAMKIGEAVADARAASIFV